MKFRQLHFQRTAYTSLAIICFLITMAFSVTLSAEDGRKDQIPDSLSVDRSVVLDASDLTESSGLAFSHRNPNRLWTHNDSGGKPVLYAFNTEGAQTGSCQLNVPMVDWEDIATFEDAGVPRLLIADCGDNQAKREYITLYLLDEPNPDQHARLRDVQIIRVKYADSPTNCEGVAVDLEKRQIVLVGKKFFAPAVVYCIPLPDRSLGSHPQTNSPVMATAQQRTQLRLPMVTGIDINSATGEVFVTGYFRAFRFRAGQSREDLLAVLKRSPEELRVPRWKQIEAIAVDASGRAWVTSEGVPARLGRLKEMPSVQSDEQ